MRKLLAYVFVGWLGPILLLCPVNAQLVDSDKARTVADNWVTTIIDHKGAWGGAEKAYVSDVAQFKRGDRVLGYYCQVEPSGHIIVSLVEGLAPIKAFSETSTLDPFSDQGPADLLKFQMERRLDVIERELGPASTAKSADLDALLILNHRETWRQLMDGPIPVAEGFSPDGTEHDYVEGTELLTSRWHQSWPYNDQCPPAPSGVPCDDPNCVVGCTATAGAQIMRYWSWPPGRDWLNMPDAMEYGPTQAEIDAVAELSHVVGVLDNMEYCRDGKCESGAPTDFMEVVYQMMSYHEHAAYTERQMWEWDEWYQFIVDNVNQNRPVHYEIRSHVIVCDGWWLLTGPMYHMNYGWADGYNAWYTVDNLYQPDSLGTPVHEKMVHNIFPKGALGAAISGVLLQNPDYPHRYVDRNCSATNAYFMAGQLIHFQPYRTMTCASGYLRFDGTPEKHTRLYTADYGRGVRIEDGAIVMQPGAGVMFRLSRPDK
jgi:peptidase C10-like protein